MINDAVIFIQKRECAGQREWRRHWRAGLDTGLDEKRDDQLVFPYSTDTTFHRKSNSLAMLCMTSISVTVEEKTQGYRGMQYNWHQ